MKKIILFSSFLFGLSYTSFSQNVGINTTGAAPNAAAILDLNTGNAGSMGFLPEQVALTAANAAGPIALPPTGLIVYNTATAGASPNNVTPGYYFNAGTAAAPNWVQFVAGNSATTASGGWLLNGNTGTVPANNFVGTTDANALNFRTNNTQRMTILSGGNVGINVAGPTRLLDVEGGAAATPTGYFLNSVNTGVGLMGLNSAASGASSGIGIIGNTLQTAGSAIAGQMGNAVITYFAGTAISGNTDVSVGGGVGVEGVCNNATGIGVLGTSTGATAPGVYGAANSTSWSGVFGYNSNASGTGVCATGNNYGFIITLVGGTGGAFTGTKVGVYANSTNNTIASLAQTPIVAQDGTGGQVDVNAWNAFTHYKIISTNYAGSVSCAVQDLSNNWVVLHCPETPEFYFEDYGEGQLVNGKAHINLDPILAKNVAIITGKHPLRVFIQLDDNDTCKGVIVTNKTTSGFDVVELNGGTSNTPFEWHVVCNVKDQTVGVYTNHLQDLRFEAAPTPYSSTTSKLLPQPKAITYH